MTQDIRLGIAGLNWGRHHLRAFAQTKGVALVALADPDPEALAQAAAELPAAQTFPSAKELIDSGAIDALVIATPTHLHERQAIRAFDADLHVLCESPIGVNGREASHVVTAAGLAGKIFAWSNPLRFDPRVAAARRSAEAGSLGELLHAVANCRLSSWPHPPDSWRLDRDCGGGALLAVAWQTIDAVWYAMGCPDPIEALGARFDFFAQAHSPKLESIAEDTLAGIVRFKNGSVLQCAAQLGPACSDSVEMQLCGSLAHASFPAPTDPSPLGIAALFAAQARHLAHVIRGEEEPVCAPKQALAMAKMTDALALSAKEKQAAPIKVERSLEDLFGGL